MTSVEAEAGVGGRQGGCIQSGGPGALSLGVTAVTAERPDILIIFEVARSALLEKNGCYGDARSAIKSLLSTLRVRLVTVFTRTRFELGTVVLANDCPFPIRVR